MPILYTLYFVVIEKQELFLLNKPVVKVLRVLLLKLWWRTERTNLSTVVTRLRKSTLSFWHSPHFPRTTACTIAHISGHSSRWQQRHIKSTVRHRARNASLLLISEARPQFRRRWWLTIVKMSTYQFPVKWEHAFLSSSRCITTANQSVTVIAGSRRYERVPAAVETGEPMPSAWATWWWLPRWWLPRYVTSRQLRDDIYNYYSNRASGRRILDR